MKYVQRHQKWYQKDVVVLMSLFLAFNIFYTFFSCLCRWLCEGKCLLGFSLFTEIYRHVETPCFGTILFLAISKIQAVFFFDFRFSNQVSIIQNEPKVGRFLAHLFPMDPFFTLSLPPFISGVEKVCIGNEKFKLVK